MPRLHHVTSVHNRESIKKFGLDWTRMAAAPGIAGSRGPEVEGCFLCVERPEVDWFIRLNNTGGPVDVWAVDGIELRHLRTSPNGHQYFPDKIAAQQLTLVRQDVRPEWRPSSLRSSESGWADADTWPPRSTAEHERKARRRHSSVRHPICRDPLATKVTKLR